MSFSVKQHEWMARAIHLAKQAWYTTSPNPRVGCVIVNDKHEIVGEGYHAKAGQPHAEVYALDMAGEKAKGATAYVTLEPCSHYGRTPPCAEGLIKAGVSKVICAMVDPNPQVSGNGIRMLEEAGIDVETGLMEAEARALNPGFIKLMEKQLPFVRCKLASSLDGKTAMASGESKWITSPQAREDVQRLRAQSCAIITGADTVIFDDAKLNVRWQQLGYLKNSYNEADIRQPTRIVIDSQNRLTPDLAIFKHQSPVVVICQKQNKDHQWPAFVSFVEVPLNSNTNKIDLGFMLRAIAKSGFNDILIEAGETLAGAFIEAGLVDELILYQAPILMGSAGRSLCSMPSVEQLRQSKQLDIKSIVQVGPDFKVTAGFKEK